MALLVGGGPPPHGFGRRLSPLGLITVLLVGLFLPMTDFFIVNVALPTINRDLNASPGMLQLVVAGYAIAYAVLCWSVGASGDALGRPPALPDRHGVVHGDVTPVQGGAEDVQLLVAFRALQGAAAAMMLPQVLSTIQATTSGNARNRALGRRRGWHCLGHRPGTRRRPGVGRHRRVAVALHLPGQCAGRDRGLRRGSPARSSPTPSRMIRLPVDTRALATGRHPLGVALPLTEGRTLGWPWWTIVLLVLSPFGAWAFVRTEKAVEQRGRMPLVPLSLLEAPSVRKDWAGGPALLPAFGGFMFVYALTLQDGARRGAHGRHLVAHGPGLLGASLSVARLLAKFGRRVLVAGGLVKRLDWC